MDHRTQWNIREEQRVAHFGGHAGSGRYGLSHLQSVRGEHITFFAVGIAEQSDASGTVRIIFDGLHLGAHVIFVTFEIDNTIHPFVTASDITDGHFTAVVAAAGTFQRAE